MEIIKSSDDYYTDVWGISGTLKFSLSYSELDKKYASIIREEKAKKENVVLHRQLIWYVPDYTYQEILKYL